jgi:two-component system chemotaxis response regulator CheY
MKILAIDDERFLLDYYKTFLTKNGHTVEISQSVNDGVSKFVKAHENEEPFDLIILDIIMPEYNGPIALQHFRELEKEYSLKAVQVIIVSGQKDLDNITFLQKLGIIDYIIKGPDIKKKILKALNKAYL